jgi:hypothetical protein
MNLQKGEIVSSYIGTLGNLVVDSVYWKDNQKHVRLNYNSMHQEALTFIEGVGPNVWFIYPYDDIGTLNCFQNQSVFYKKPAFWWGKDCPCGYMSLSGRINPIEQEQDYRLFIKKDHLEIQLTEPQRATVTLYDIQGHLYFQKELFPMESLFIPTGSLPKGIYILKILNKNKMNVNKIIL